MVRQRSIEIWHVPKRGSIHQIIGALNIIQHFRIDGKPWPSTKRKLFDQKFAMWGFTSRGRSLSRNASETLEALIKYLGLLVVDQEGKIKVTPAGKALIEEFPVKEPKKKKRKLKETMQSMGTVSSGVIKKQMMKLILTNPTVLAYCRNMKIAPFRETLRLLLDEKISYLTPEEMAMFLFHMKNTAQKQRVRGAILRFRSLSANRRNDLVERYKGTPEGNLTLRQAPTAIYWRQLCMNTGLFEVDNASLKLRSEKEQEVKDLLKKYEDEIYNFKSNKQLWYEYFTIPRRIRQPIDIRLKLRHVGPTEYSVAVLRGKKLMKGLLIDGERIFEVPVFPNEEIRITATDLETGDVVRSVKRRFGQREEFLEIDVLKKKKSEIDKNVYAGKISEHISSPDFDTQYQRHLKIVGDHLGRDLLNRKSRASLRGGRLEFLFARLLEQLELEGRIRSPEWNGFIDEFGVMRPAPGLRSGQPDISFKCGKMYYLLELTTIRAASGQWTAEGSSVPYHIKNFVTRTRITDVIGIFCPPVVHERVDASLKNTLIPDRCYIICLAITDFVDILVKSSNLEQSLGRILEDQYKRSQ